MINKFFENTIFFDVIKLLRDDNIDIMKEAVWIVQNTFFIANEIQLGKLLKQGIFELTIDLLKIKDVILQANILSYLSKFLNRDRKSVV